MYIFDQYSNNTRVEDCYAHSLSWGFTALLMDFDPLEQFYDNYEHPQVSGEDPPVTVLGTFAEA